MRPAPEERTAPAACGMHKPQLLRRLAPAWWIALTVVATFAGLSGAFVLFGPEAAAKPQPTNHVGTVAGVGFIRLPGTPAPPFSVANLSDPLLQESLKSLQGRPLVINFWASWCVPCRKEMPAIEAAHSQLGPSVTFLGIDSNDSRDAALSFAALTGVTYHLGFDPDGAVASSYGVYGLPTTFFVSADGRLVGRQTGPMTESRLESLVNMLFAVHINQSPS